jgi:hypothetical protein
MNDCAPGGRRSRNSRNRTRRKPRVLTDICVLTGGGEEGERTVWDPGENIRSIQGREVAATRHRALPQIVQHLAGNMQPKGLGFETAGSCLCRALTGLHRPQRAASPAPNGRARRTHYPPAHHDKIRPTGYGHSSSVPPRPPQDLPACRLPQSCRAPRPVDLVSRASPLLHHRPADVGPNAEDRMRTVRDAETPTAGLGRQHVLPALI